MTPRTPPADRPGTILVITHNELADVSWIDELARTRAGTLQIVSPIAGDGLPAHDAVAAAIVLGGEMSADDDDEYPALATERTWLRTAVDTGLPVLGICLGSQLLSVALGGAVQRGDTGLEHGYIDVVGVPGASHPLAHTLAGTHFSFHSDSYVLPPGAQILARTERYVQAWSQGSALSLQFHPELSPTGIQALVDVEGPKLATHGVDAGGWVAEATRRSPQSRTSADRIIGGWLDRALCPPHLSTHRSTPMITTTHAPFIERHHLYTPEAKAQAAESLARIGELDIEVIRLAWPDQHGLLRGKSMSRDGYASALANGVEITMAPFFFDTANAIVFNPFSPDGGFDLPGLQGSPNVIMVPDPSTFRVLPWAPETAWVLCDTYMRDGQPFPFSPRAILRRQLEELSQEGLRLIAGLEVEWYLTKVIDENLSNGSLGAPGMPGDPPTVAPVARGYNYLLENHLDQIDEALRPIRRSIQQLGLPLRSFDDEWAPSQIETTFDVLEGMAAADAATLFRMAVKQVARRNGYHASFMCTPAVAGFYGSGWHLHTSLQDLHGNNVMIPGEGEALSELGRHYVGGTLAHGAAASVFTTPTVNGYRRRRPYSLAPDRLSWGLDNRAAMVRVISYPGDPVSHVENRVGEPAANPYLYLAAQAAAGLDGIRCRRDPGPPSEDPYAEDVQRLPQSLAEAVDTLAADQFYRTAFGDAFIDYMVAVKRSELSRYDAWLEQHPNSDEYVNGVTDWEHREYFELF